MLRCSLVALAVLALAGLSSAADSGEGKLVLDVYDTAFVGGNRAGYIHTTVRELEQQGMKLYKTTVDLDLTFRRFKQTIKQNMRTGTVETSNGQVVAVFMRQGLATKQTLALSGVVKGKELHVKVSGQVQMDKKIPWNPKVVGLYREQYLFKERGAKPGDRFSYLHYEPLINAVVTIKVAVKDYEDVVHEGKKQKLLRVEAIPDKIMNVQLPGTNFWLNKDLTVVRTQVEMPPLGKLSMVRTTRETALLPVGKVTDIGLTQLIPLNRRIPKPHTSNSAIYRVTIPKDDNPAKALPQDARQSVMNARGKSFDLHIKAVREPGTSKTEAKAGKKFLASNYFVKSEDGRVKELAKKAVGAETDPWKKAKKIESWVHNNMRVQNFSEAMATADHVARTLQGDCTEYAMLTAAMCRAEGVPSRTAIGLVYVDLRNQGPVFAYHMWTEVWIKGEWLALDATLGRGSIGAGHIKVTDHSWHDTRSMVPLFPVMRVMLGKMTVEVVSVK